LRKDSSFFSYLLEKITPRVFVLSAWIVLRGMVGEKIVLISGSLYCRRSRYLRYTVFGLAGVLAYFRFRGVRLVSCPETAESAAVEVNARHAALTRGSGHVELTP
jgi:hypothetical protein